MVVVPKTTVALLTRVGEDPSKALALLLLEAMVSDIRGQFSERDDAIDAASALFEGLKRSGLNEVGVHPFLLARTKRTPDVA